ARYMPPPWLSGDTDPPLRVAMESFVEGKDAWRCPGDPVVFDMEYTDEQGDTHICGMSYTYETGLSGRTHAESFFARFLHHRPADTPISYEYDGGGYEMQDGAIVQVQFFHRTRNVLFAD